MVDLRVDSVVELAVACGWVLVGLVALVVSQREDYLHLLPCSEEVLVVAAVAVVDIDFDNSLAVVELVVVVALVGEGMVFVVGSIVSYILPPRVVVV